MAANRKLSANEVEALVDGLRGDGTAAPGGALRAAASGRTEQAAGAEVRPFVFGANDISALGDYHALRMINERFCRIARSVFLPMLRIQPRISSFPPEIRSFDDYRQKQDNFVSLTNSRIDELRGNQLIVIPPSFISLLTDAYYGGAIRHVKTQRNEFTATEQRVIEIVTQRLNNALQLAWRDLMKMTFTIASREENMQFAAFIDGEDMVVRCSFHVQLPNSEPAHFDILYPLQTLKPISSQLRSRMQSDTVEDDRTWRVRLEQAILTIPLKVTARLCQPTVPLRQLHAMQEGDILPVTLGESVEVLVGGKPMYTAAPGAVGGQAAVSILRRQNG